MKILLLEHPRSICPERCNDIANTPLSSCMLNGYVAAILKSKGHHVEIIEGYMDRLSYDEIENIVRTFEPDILGVHMVYHWQDDEALYGFLRLVKDDRLAKVITVFGFYPTIAYEDVLKKCKAIDSVIVGEPEITFTELVERADMEANPEANPGTNLEANPEANPGVNPEANPGLSGLAIRDGSGGIVCEYRPLVEDLNSLPFPVRTEAAFRLPEVNIQGSRGCYGGCTFCYINPFYGQGSQWRGRTPENIVEEIDSIIAEKGIRDFYFTDPNFFGPGRMGQERAVQLASLLKLRNIRFGIEGRVNDIHDETIRALVEAGLRHILIGLESGKNSSLKRMNKMTTVEQNEEAVRILRKYGIEPNIGFIMFEPDANLEDIQVNFDFLKRNELLKHLPITANVLYHHQIILRGTPAYKNMQQQGRLVTQNDSSYEGAAVFSNTQVAALAGIMRKITNFLFDRMNGIWSGRVEAPVDARQRYAEVNRLLISAFQDNLRLLQSGQKLTDDQVDLLAQETNNHINSILSFQDF